MVRDMHKDPFIKVTVLVQPTCSNTAPIERRNSMQEPPSASLSLAKAAGALAPYLLTSSNTNHSRRNTPDKHKYVSICYFFLVM